MRSMRGLFVLAGIFLTVIVFAYALQVFAEGGVIRVYEPTDSPAGDTTAPNKDTTKDSVSAGDATSANKEVKESDECTTTNGKKVCRCGFVEYSGKRCAKPPSSEGSCLPRSDMAVCSNDDMKDLIKTVDEGGKATYNTPGQEPIDIKPNYLKNESGQYVPESKQLSDAFKDESQVFAEEVAQRQFEEWKANNPTQYEEKLREIIGDKSLDDYYAGQFEKTAKELNGNKQVPTLSGSLSDWSQYSFLRDTGRLNEGGFLDYLSDNGVRSFSINSLFNPGGTYLPGDTFGGGLESFVSAQPNTFSPAAFQRLGPSYTDFANSFARNVGLSAQQSGAGPVFVNPNSVPGQLSDLLKSSFPGVTTFAPFDQNGNPMQWDPVQGKFVPIKDPTKLTPVDPNEPSSLIKTALKSPLLGENTDLKDFDKVAINDVPKVFDLEDGTNVAPGITTAPVQDEKLEALGISAERPTLNSIVETARESGGNAVARSLSLLERWGLSDGFTVRDFANLPTLNDFRMTNLPEGTKIVGITDQDVISREGNISVSQSFLKENEWRLRMQENGRALYEAKQTLGEKAAEYQKLKEEYRSLDRSRYLAAEEAINKFADEKGLTLSETGKLVSTRNLSPQEISEFTKLSKEYDFATEDLIEREAISGNLMKWAGEDYEKSLSDYRNAAAEFDYTNLAYRTEKDATLQVLKDYYGNIKYDAFGKEVGPRFDAFGREYSSGLAASLQDSTSKSIIESQMAQTDLQARIASLRADRTSFIEQSAGDVNTFAGMGSEGWPSQDRAAIDATIKDFDTQISAAESELAKLKAQETLNSGISRSLLDAGDSSKASPTADAIAKTILDPGTNPQDLARREALLNAIVKGETVRTEQSRFTDYVKENIISAQDRLPTKQLTAAIERWQNDLEVQTGVFADKLAKATNQIQELSGVKQVSPETQKLLDAITGDNLTDRQKSRAADYEYYKSIAESWKPDPDGTLRVLDPSWWKAGAAGYAAHVIQNVDTLESFVTGQGALKDTQMASILDNGVERGARIVSASAELAMDAMIVTDAARFGAKFFSTTGRELALAEANLGVSGVKFQPSFIDELAGAEAKAAQVYASSVAKTVEAEVASGTIRPFEAEARAYGNLYDTLARSDLSPVQKQSVLGALAAEMETKGYAAPIRGAEGSAVTQRVESVAAAPGVDSVVSGPRFTPPGATSEAFNEGSTISSVSGRQTPAYISTEGTPITPQNISALDEVRAATEQSVRAATLSVLETGGELTPARIISALDQNTLDTALQGISEKYGGMQFKGAAITYEQTVAANSAVDAVRQIGSSNPGAAAPPRDVVETLSRTPLSEWKDAVTLTPPQRLNKVAADYLSNTAADVLPKSGNFNRNFSAALAEPERAAALTKAVRALEQQTGKKFSESEIRSAITASRPAIEKEWAEMASASGATVPAQTLLRRIQDRVADTLAALTPDIAGKPMRSAVLAMQLLSTPLAPHINTQTLGGALVRGASIATEVLNPISSAVAREVNTSGPFTRVGLSPSDAASVYARPQTTLATTYGFAGDAVNPFVRTSSGYVLDPNLLSAAHRELPLGSVVKVTNTENGKAIAVVINNRGELSPNKLIDLSPGAQAELRGKAISSVNNDTTPVKYELVYVPPQTIASRYEKNPSGGTFKELAGLTRAQSAAIVANPEAVKNLSFGAQGDLTPLARVQTTLASGDVVGASRAAVGNTPIRDVVKVLDTPPLGNIPTFKPATIESVIVPVTKAAENIQALSEVAQKAVLKAAEDMGASMITARNVKTADDAVRALTQQAKEVESALARLGAQSVEHAPDALDALQQLRKAQTELKGVMNESLSPEAVNRAFAKVATEVDRSHAVVDVMAKSKGVTENALPAGLPQKMPERITAVQNVTREVVDAVSLPARTLKQGEESLGQVVRQAQSRAAQSAGLPTYKDFVALARSSGQIPIPGVPRTIYLPGSEFSAAVPHRSFIVNHDQWGSNALARATTYHNGGVSLGTRYWVTRDGNVVVARRDGIAEAHVGGVPPADSNGRRLLNVTNSNSVGIEFEGFGHLTPKQIESGLALNLFLQARHGIPPSNVVAHAKATGQGVVEGTKITEIVRGFGHLPEKVASFLGNGIQSLGQTIRETGVRTAGWISDTTRRVTGAAQEQIRYVMKTDATRTAAAQPKMPGLSQEARQWFAENTVAKTLEPVRMAASRYGLPEGPIGYGIGMSSPAGIPNNVKVVFGPYIDTMPAFAQAARAQGITPAGYVNTVCQGSSCAGYVQAGKARLEVIGGHREFRFTDQTAMLEYVGKQIDGMKQLGIRSADFGNVDGYANSWVASVVDLAQQKDFGVWLKNPNLMKGDVAGIVKKPNVVGFFVEQDPTSTLSNLLKLRADAGRPDVTVLFAGGHGNTGPWIRNIQAEVATGKYQNVAVSVGPSGEYQGVIATAWAPPAGTAQTVSGRATSLPVLPEKFHQEVKLSYPQAKGVRAQIWFDDGVNRFPITQEQLRALSPEVAKANVTVDVLFNGGVKNVPLTQAPKALENAFEVATKTTAPDVRSVLAQNLINKDVAPRGAPVTQVSQNPLFRNETIMPIAFADGTRGSAALRTFATPEYARAHAAMVAAIKEGKVPASAKQLQGEALLWGDPQTPRYQYRADVEGTRVTITKIDVQGQKSLTPGSKLFQPQTVFETNIEKPQMGIVTLTKRSGDSVPVKGDTAGASTGKASGDDLAIKPGDTSVAPATPAAPTTPLGPISIINAPGEMARVNTEPPLSGWKKMAAVLTGVIAAPLAYLGIGNDGAPTAPPAATTPTVPTAEKESIVEEKSVDVPEGKEGDGCVAKVAADLGVNVECPTPAPSETPPPQTPPTRIAGREGDGRSGLGRQGGQGQPQSPQSGNGSPQGGAPVAQGKPPVSGMSGGAPSVPGTGVNNGTTDKALAQLTCPVAAMTNVPFSVKWVCAPSMTSQGTGFSTGGLVRGTATTSITAATTFGLACAGTNAAAATCTTKVIAPKTVLTAAPTEVDPGQKVVIAWVTTETTNCSLYGPQSILRSGGTANVHVIPTLTRSTEFALACGTTGGATIKRTVVVRVRGNAGEIDPAVVPESDTRAVPETEEPTLDGSNTSSDSVDSTNSSNTNPQTNANPGGYTATDQNGNQITLCDPMMGIYRFTQCLLKKPY